MSSIGIGTAVDTSNPFLTQPFWFDNTYQADELFAHLPFLAIPGSRFRVNVIDIPNATALGATGTVPVTPNAADGQDLTVLPGSQAKLAYDTIINFDFWVKRIVGDVDLSRFLEFNFSAQNSQLGHQIAAKKLAARYEYSRMLIGGTGGGQNDPQFLGLSTLAGVVPSQSLAGTGNIPNDCDALVSRIRAANGRADFIAMSFSAFAVYAGQLRAAGVRLALVPDPLAPASVCPAHQGVPIYRSQFIPTETIPMPPVFSTEIFAGVFGYPSGLFGLYQASVGAHGMHVEHAYASPTRDNATWRIAWHAGLAVTNSNAVAKVAEVGLPSPAPLQ